MPVYVQLRSKFPSLPFLISYPISVPNWKLYRRSSMDQDRLVSIRMPSVGSAIRSSSSQVPGSRLTLVMRIMGSRFHEEALIQPLEANPRDVAVSLDIKYPTNLPSFTMGVDWAATPSSSQPKVPRPGWRRLSAVMFTN